MIIQLNPEIPMTTPRGFGYAFLCIDYSQEHNLIWVVSLNDDGQIWAFDNTEVRCVKNATMGRALNETDRKNLQSVRGHCTE